MYSTEKGQLVKDYPVNKDFGDEESFFRVITESGEVQLPKLAFQKEQPLPDTLSCRIKGYNNGVPMLVHNVPRYVSEFYADGFSRGEDFEFKVTAIPFDENGYYRLADKNGLSFKLHEPKSSLALGQSVRCRFDYLDQDKFNLRRSISDAQFPMFSLRDLAKAAGEYKLSIESIRSALAKIPEMAKPLEELAHSRSSWILLGMRAARTILPRWFKDALNERTYESIKNVLHDYRRVAMFLLQGSGFLRNIKGKERTDLQKEFTDQIENIDIYLRTLEIIHNNRQHKFIKDLLDNLKESGYLFHPKAQFSIMMILFRLSPELVNSSLGNIFDTLMGWNPETWRAEPFRQAFVEQLQIYINETRQDIECFLLAETAADTEKIEKVLTAIAIQNSLFIPGDQINLDLNMSLFYRYLSLLRSARAEVLLDKSYLSLMGAKLPVDFTWSDIKEPTMMMTRAAVDPPRNITLPEEPAFYRTSEHEIEVSRDGIAVSLVHENVGGVIPNGMLSWPGLQVNVQLEKNMNRQKFKTLDGHDEFWTCVEKALFVPKETVTEQPATKLRADVGDVVNIVVDMVIANPNDPNRIEGFRCRVVDSHFIEEDGIMKAENLVSYNLHGVTVGTFRHDNGEPMQFEATVIDVDANDRLEFSMLDLTHQAVRDMANTGEKCYCVITKDNGRSYSAISEKGFGLYINKYKDDTTPFHRGNIVLASITGYDNDAVQGVVEEGPIDNFLFSNARALRNMLLAVANDTTVYEEDSDIYEENKLPRETVNEIIEILRYKAVSERADNIVAFDYLSYARILAIIVNNTEMADVLKAHKEILLQYQKYAKNKQLFPEEIDAIVDIAPGSVLVQRLAARLYIVGALGHSDHNSRLWDIVNISGTEAEKQLAQAVLSYNFLYDSVGEDETTTAIKDRIATMLNVDSEQNRLKYYSSESQYVEFKSSMVYPARKGRAGISMADPDRQEYEILHIIAGFLNSTGGVLYIGVNDDHYERGLADDFNFYKMDTSERNTKFRRSIKSLDNLTNYLQNLIDSSFSIGKIAGDYAKAYIDDESVKGVILVKVDPCPHIVYFDDKIFVRHSAKTEPLTRPEEIEMFIADRSRLYQQQVQANSSPVADTSTETVQDVATESTPVIPAATDIPAAEPTVGFSVQTSAVRNNILHEWQDPDRFVPAKYYIRFIGENGFMLVRDEWSLEDTDRLDLNVHEDEADGYLVMVYEDEYVIRIPLRELAKRNANTLFQHYADRKLVFATIASADSGLYSLHANAKNAHYERVTPVEKLAQGSMTSTPERILEAECPSTVMWEVVPPAKMGDFSGMISTGMKRTQLGVLAKGVNAIKTATDEIRNSVLQMLRQ